LARPETVAYYNVQNPVVNNKRPGLCWGKLHQEYFADSSFTILSIFGLAVSNLKSDFPDAALEHRNPDIHRAFLNLLDHDSGFAFFCRKVSENSHKNRTHLPLFLAFSNVPLLRYVLRRGL